MFNDDRRMDVVITRLYSRLSEINFLLTKNYSIQRFQLDAYAGEEYEQVLETKENLVGLINTYMGVIEEDFKKYNAFVEPAFFIHDLSEDSTVQFIIETLNLCKSLDLGLTREDEEETLKTTYSEKELVFIKDFIRKKKELLVNDNLVEVNKLVKAYTITRIFEEDNSLRQFCDILGERLRSLGFHDLQIKVEGQLSSNVYKDLCVEVQDLLLRSIKFLEYLGLLPEYQRLQTQYVDKFIEDECNLLLVVKEEGEQNA